MRDRSTTRPGAWGTATAVPAAAQAADEMLAALHRLRPDGPPGRSPDQILRDAGPALPRGRGATPAAGPPGCGVWTTDKGTARHRRSRVSRVRSFSYIAHFVEVRIEPTTRRIRVPRVVSVADCGRVVSPRTARSQVNGGVVWGIGCALREASEVDSRFGGFLNADLAEYLVPVNADIGDLDVDFIDEPDPLLNDVGVKGLGEVALVGVAAAIANAVYHATGRRVRRLPIRIEDLL